MIRNDSNKCNNNNASYTHGCRVLLYGTRRTVIRPSSAAHFALTMRVCHRKVSVYTVIADNSLKLQFLCLFLYFTRVVTTNKLSCPVDFRSATSRTKRNVISILRIFQHRHFPFCRKFRPVFCIFSSLWCTHFQLFRKLFFKNRQ